MRYPQSFLDEIRARLPVSEVVRKRVALKKAGREWKGDRALINLKHMDVPVIDLELREREALLSADMGLDTSEDLKQLYAEFQAAGVAFFQPLQRMPWGADTFIVKDPDGNLLLFAGPAE
jgi:hypothetical protein